MAHFKLLAVSVLVIVAVVEASHLDPDILYCCKNARDTNNAECIKIMESCNNNNALDSPTGLVGGCCEQFLGNNSQQHRSLENKNVGHRFMMHEPFVKTYQNASKPSKGDRWRNFLIRKQILKLQRQSRLDKDAFVKKVQEIFANNKTALTTSVPTSPIVITLSPAVDTTRPPAPAPRTKAEKRIITRFKLFEDSPWNVFLTKHYYGDTEGYGIGIESSKS